MKKIMILSLILLFVTTSSIKATEWLVYDSDDLHQAVYHDSVSGDTIKLYQNTYHGIWEGSCDQGQPDPVWCRAIDPLGKNLIIKSTDPNDPDVVAGTIISGYVPARCGNETIPECEIPLYIHNGESSSCKIIGLTIRTSPNYTEPDAEDMAIGGISCDGASPSIIRCVIKAGNDPDYSGLAIYCHDSSTIIQDCDISDNRASAVSGIWIEGSSNVTINNCSFQNNNSLVIKSDGEDFAISNCDFSNNSGSAIIHYGHDFTMKNCNITDCDGSVALGIYTSDNSPTLIENCTISDNTDGAIKVSSSNIGEVTISKCRIKDNTAGHDGGGIFFPSTNTSSSLTIKNCEITGNKALGSCNGGGIYSYKGIAILDSIITGNKVDECGGGLYIRSVTCDTNIENCTIADNYAGGGTSSHVGGGAYFQYSYPSQKVIGVVNCIFWGNSTGETPDSWGQIGTNWSVNSTSFVSIKYSDVEDSNGSGMNWGPTNYFAKDGTNNHDVDPYFVSAGRWVDADDPETTVDPSVSDAKWIQGDYHLKSDSPCIDEGEPGTYTGRKDIDMEPRVIPTGGTAVDMGADEVLGSGIGYGYNGGIRILGSASVSNCKIRNNSCGLYLKSVDAKIKNNLIYANGDGIKLLNNDSGPLIRNNTIVDNTNFGILNILGVSFADISNCIFRDNTDDLSGAGATYSCIETSGDETGTGNITANPSLDGNYHLQSNSPCINAGDSDPEESYTGEVDIDFGTRVVNSYIDMGCDEYNP